MDKFNAYLYFFFIDKIKSLTEVLKIIGHKKCSIMLKIEIAPL